MDFGAFVELLPGKDGMVHISEFSNERIDKITDVASVGKMLKVKVLEVDPSGKIKLSVKQADPDYKHQKREFGGGSRDGGGKSNYGSRGGFKK
jgi:polyribonucleotide nucleotidyltransferase